MDSGGGSTGGEEWKLNFHEMNVRVQDWVYEVVHSVSSAGDGVYIEI